MRTTVLLFFSLWMVVSAFAHTFVEKTFTCPIDGNEFKQTVDASGTQFGRRLDLKPIGPTAAPWSLPQCPTCKFIIYDQTLGKDTVEKLKPFILSKEYRDAAENNSSYFALALIRQFLGDADYVVGYAYLEASWQVESEEKKCRQYLELAHTKFVARLATLKPEDEGYVTAVLLSGELERRLGQFEEASRRFKAVKTDERFKDAFIQQIIDRQMQFITEKNTAPHAVDKKLDADRE